MTDVDPVRYSVSREVRGLADPLLTVEEVKPEPAAGVLPELRAPKAE